jgi:hypothetical protein
MERYCSTGQSPQRAVAPTEEEEYKFNPLNPELNPICYLLALLDHHFLHINRISVKKLVLGATANTFYAYRIREN